MTWGRLLTYTGSCADLSSQVNRPELHAGWRPHEMDTYVLLRRLRPAD